MVKLIVFWGGDINIRGDDDLTPLHSAARFKIIQKGPNFSKKSDNGLYSSNPYQNKPLNNLILSVDEASNLDIKEILSKYFKVPNNHLGTIIKFSSFVHLMLHD